MNQQQTTGSCVKIVGEIGKSSSKHGREQKFRRTPHPLSCKHPLCSSKKIDWRWFATNWSQTVCEPCTNYAKNIVFANEMFANVYAALHVCTELYSKLLVPHVKRTIYSPAEHSRCSSSTGLCTLPSFDAALKPLSFPARLYRKDWNANCKIMR